MSDAMEVPEEVKIFLVEAYENLDQVEQDLVSLEQDSSDPELLNSVFRSVHTIKGNSGFLAFQKLEKICHTAEAVLDRLRNGALTFTPELATALLSFVDIARSILESLEQSGVEGDAEIADIVSELEKFKS
jgi:two-component system chemotaxis sensor kinase CheA